MRIHHLSGRCAALLLAVCLLLTSCGGGAKATTMHLRRTEGKVSVSDGGGKDVEPREDLGLYSGYEVDTRSESYAWIDLDSVKLTKLDEDSEIAITKEGKDLEIEVLSGSLFFDVTQPLETDETMTIRSSTMLVGIRGTCGWVSLSEDEEQLSVYLLEGKVRCEADGEKETVRAGEMAVMTGDGEITVSSFAEADVPEFVMDELDEDLLDEVRSFLPQGPSPEAIASLGTIAYYGDPAQCAMTPEQAAAFAQAIRDKMAQLETDRQTRMEYMPNLRNQTLECYASLFDTGNGVPALFWGGGAIFSVNGNEYLWGEVGGSGLWLYSEGEGAVPASKYSGHTTALYNNEYLFCGGIQGGSGPGLPVEYRVYPLTGSGIAVEPSTTARYEGESAGTYTVDGRPASKEQYNDWVAQWRDSAASSTGGRAGGGVEGYFWGMSPAADVLAVLDGWAGGTVVQLP